VEYILYHGGRAYQVKFHGHSQSICLKNKKGLLI